MALASAPLVLLAIASRLGVEGRRMRKAISVTRAPAVRGRPRTPPTMPTSVLPCLVSPAFSVSLVVARLGSPRRDRLIGLVVGRGMGRPSIITSPSANVGSLRTRAPRRRLGMARLTGESLGVEAGDLASKGPRRTIGVVGNVGVSCLA